jgi:hypothetical protein
MTHRQELVLLIENGMRPDAIYEYFANQHVGRSSILELLKQSGVTIPIPDTRDDITDERRKFLQELSLSD